MIGAGADHRLALGRPRDRRLAKFPAGLSGNQTLNSPRPELTAILHTYERVARDADVFATA